VALSGSPAICRSRVGIILAFPDACYMRRRSLIVGVFSFDPRSQSDRIDRAASRTRITLESSRGYSCDYVTHVRKASSSSALIHRRFIGIDRKASRYRTTFVKASLSFVSVSKRLRIFSRAFRKLRSRFSDSLFPFYHRFRSSLARADRADARTDRNLACTIAGRSRSISVPSGDLF